MDGGDVRMMNLRRHLRFAEKARAVNVVGEQPLLHHLDAAEGVEMDVPRLEHLPHPARAEEVQDLVLAVEQRSRPEAVNSHGRASLNRQRGTWVPKRKE